MKDYAVTALLLAIAGLLFVRSPQTGSNEKSGHETDAPQFASAATGSTLPLSALTRGVASKSDRAPRSDAATGNAQAAPITLETLALSLDYLERDGAAWMHGESPLNQNDGCISCHVVSFAVWSHSAVEKAGYSRKPSIDDLAAEAMAFIDQPGIGRAVTWSQMILGRSPSDHERYDWRSLADPLVASQESDGRWRARGQFPSQRRPERESDGVATMWALLALNSLESREDYANESMTEGYTWLDEQSEGVSTEWLAMRLLVEIRIGAPERAQARLERFIELQHEDGGWSWVADGADEPSDAYATGVALYTLRQIGLSPVHPAVRAAVDALVASQNAEGIWSLPSRLTSAEASSEKDYIYEYWATAWAVIGLAEVLPEPSRATAG